MSSLFGEQGWRSSESARIPPMCPGFASRTRRHMWVELVVGSLLRSERFFSGYSGFSLCRFQFDLDYCRALSLSGASDYQEPLARVIA